MPRTCAASVKQHYCPTSLVALTSDSIRDNGHGKTRLDTIHEAAHAKAQDIMLGKDMMVGECFEIGHIEGGQDQNEIGIPGHEMALHDFGRGLHGGLESVQISLAFVLQAHLDNKDQPAPDSAGMKDRDFGLDYSREAQPCHTLAAGSG